MIHGYTSPRFLGGLYRTLYPFAAVLPDINTLPSTRIGTNVTAAGSTHTKGAYTTLIASTTNAVYQLNLGIRDPGAGGTQYSFLLDLAVGAAAAETNILDNLDVGFSTPQESYRWWTLGGVYIPANTRISARIQCSTASRNLYMLLAASGAIAVPPAASAWTTYGAVTASSRGTSVTPGNGVWGSWTSIGTTTANHSIFVVGAGPNNSSLSSAGYRLWEVGFGPDSSTVTIIGTQRCAHVSGAGLSTIEPQVLNGSVPSGSNLYIRAADSYTSAMGMTIHAL